jgi:NAD(P)H-hydrate epimerase
VEVADIGIPAAAVEAEKADLFWLDAAAAAALLPERKPIAHKGDFGHALIVAGSRGKSGAAILMARACLRSGAGLVTVACPASVQHIIATAVPEAMTEPLPETADGAIARGAVPRVLALLKDRDVLATGPGIGTEPETREVVLGIARGAQKPMVLDADALNILAGGGLADISGQAVITPHPGEAGRLLRRGTKEIQADRLAAVRELAEASGCVSVLKGYRSLVAEPGGRVHVNESGNPGMATGGSGDVLTGIVVAWLAQGLTPANAALLSVFAHGRAGDISAGELGEISLMAGDIINGLPRAYRELTALRWKK